MFFVALGILVGALGNEDGVRLVVDCLRLQNVNQTKRKHHGTDKMRTTKPIRYPEAGLVLWIQYNLMWAANPKHHRVLRTMVVDDAHN